jgi:hypothetical protein
LADGGEPVDDRFVPQPMTHRHANRWGHR